MDTIPQSLNTFLADREIRFAGYVSGEYPYKLLDSYGVKIGHLVSIYGDNKKIQLQKDTDMGFAEKVRKLVGLDIERPAIICPSSDWGARNLSKKQIKYAAVDAYASWLMGKNRSWTYPQCVFIGSV